ncbi:MAG: polysaccharide biosynthesis protein [Rickettsiaceae bacterium]|nr:polysaccharide biosynthesis protein [Rickettsiaceae bacterium]
MRNIKTLLITGTGSLARRLMYRWKDRYDRIVAVSRGETTHLNLPEWVIGELCDVRDYNRLDYLFSAYQPMDVIHTSAYKVLGLMQNYAMECFKTNVIGTNNVAALSHKYKVSRSLLIATDKACNPIHHQNYAISKAMARNIYVDYAARPSDTSFLCCIYGNIIRSKNSMIPKWENLIKEDKEVVIYHEDLTRFMFSLDDSVDLINKTLNFNLSGTTTIPIMDSYRIVDVAKALGIILNKEVKIKILNQLLPGEKMNEEMTSINESHLIKQLDPKTLCVVPSFDIGKDYSYLKPYSGLPLRSDNCIDNNINNIINLINRSTVD